MQEDLMSYFTNDGQLLFYTNKVLLDELKARGMGTINSFQMSLKPVLLHNGNKLPSVLLADTTSMKGNYMNMKLLVEKM